MRSLSPRALTTASFAAIGLAGGYLVDALFARPISPLPIVGGTTSILCAIIGYIVAPRRHRLLHTLWLGGLGGVLNGLILGSLLVGPHVLREAMRLGALFSLPFLPALAWVGHCAARIGRARPGSLVDRTDRRAVLRAVALGIGMTWIVGVGLGIAGQPLSPLVGITADVLLALVALGDLRACLRAREADRLSRVLEPSDSTAAVEDACCLDLGLGDLRYLHVRRHDLLRGPPDARVMLIGDPMKARSVATRALCANFVVLLLFYAACALAVWIRS